MSGVSGLDDIDSQYERLIRMIKVWTDLSNRSKDYIAVGDANICAMKWLNSDYNLKSLGDLVQTFLLETESEQTVKEYTRAEIVRGNQLARSLIDHCYTNIVHSLISTEVVDIGSSDHRGIFITRNT